MSKSKYKNWSSRRKDIRLLENVFSKAKTIVSTNNKDNELTSENYLEFFPWLPKAVERFRSEHKNKSWLTNLLRALDEVLAPTFQSPQQQEMIVNALMFSLQNYVIQNKLENTFQLNEEDLIPQHDEHDHHHDGTCDHDHGHDHHHHHAHDGPCDHKH